MQEDARGVLLGKVLRHNQGHTRFHQGQKHIYQGRIRFYQGHTRFYQRLPPVKTNMFGKAIKI